MDKPIHSILGFQGEYRFLSNFWPCEVWCNGIEFTSVEHAYVAAKTKDKELQKKIAQIEKPGDVKRFGRTFTVRPDWDMLKLDVMHDLVFQKFMKEPLRSKLLDTGEAYLEETNNWGDVFWGVYQGSGYNHLGNILMLTRDRVR